MAAAAPFDPRALITALNEDDPTPYLDAHNAVAWLRSEHPDAQIETALVPELTTETMVTIRATVRIPSTGALATGISAQEQSRNRGQGIQVCETQAIRRALQNLGYSVEMVIARYGALPTPLPPPRKAEGAGARPRRARPPANALDAPPRTAGELYTRAHRAWGLRPAEVAAQLGTTVEQLSQAPPGQIEAAWQTLAAAGR